MGPSGVVIALLRPLGLAVVRTPRFGLLPAPPRISLCLLVGLGPVCLLVVPVPLVDFARCHFGTLGLACFSGLAAVSVAGLCVLPSGAVRPCCGTHHLGCSAPLQLAWA